MKKKEELRKEILEHALEIGRAMMAWKGRKAKARRFDVRLSFEMIESLKKEAKKLNVETHELVEWLIKELIGDFLEKEG